MLQQSLAAVSITVGQANLRGTEKPATDDNSAAANSDVVARVGLIVGGQNRSSSASFGGRNRGQSGEIVGR